MRLLITRLTARIAVVAVIGGVIGSTAPVGHANPARVGATQELVKLLSAHQVFAVPGADVSTGIVLARRPITAETTVLPVITRATTADGAIHWLLVRLPGRPNGHKGWIKQNGTALTTTSWHILVLTAARRVLVYRSGRLTRSFLAVIGKPTTPTPHGQFFVEENVRMPSDSAGAPFALALSARSYTLRRFEGGTGQIAIHGMVNLGGEPGTAVSHGCVRLTNQNIGWLAARIPVGTPVTISS